MTFCLQLETTIEGLDKKAENELEILQELTTRHLDKKYPSGEWIRAYTDGSAMEAVEKGGSGVYIEIPNGDKIEKAIPSGLRCTNYKAEVEAIREAANLLGNLVNNKSKVVILSDAKSVLQSLENTKDFELDTLKEKLGALKKGTESCAIQWVPGHCDLEGNDIADRLAREGSEMDQQVEEITFQEAKTMIRSKGRTKWQAKHPKYDRRDAIRRLDRKGQTCIFRLRTGHNRLRHHMHKTFKIGETGDCLCGKGQETTRHILLECSLLEELRNDTWGEHLDIDKMLYGQITDLRRTVNFIEMAGINP